MTAPLLTTSDLGDLSPMRAVLTVLDGRLRPTPPRLAAVIANIDANPLNVPLVSRLAKWARLRKDMFEVEFRAATGMRPQHYITLGRMRVAEDLLASTDMTAEQVGLRIGYQSKSAFATAFRAAKGMTPLDYRRQVRP
jgi:transcriptional regulator GlxA family with amidase domain